MFFSTKARTWVRHVTTTSEFLSFGTPWVGATATGAIRSLIAGGADVVAAACCCGVTSGCGLLCKATAASELGACGNSGVSSGGVSSGFATGCASDITCSGPGAMSVGVVAGAAANGARSTTIAPEGSAATVSSASRQVASVAVNPA
ncbi:hypothetical protein V1274_006647 [Bradyrhizobium sp. AZCC 1614]|uniref:hypothetical protein n=1 Tax=Bradyrhizobium sp. AZCC 1614 TaxID=3117017 RepID=UPI002FF2C6D3